MQATDANCLPAWAQDKACMRCHCQYMALGMPSLTVPSPAQHGYTLSMSCAPLHHGTLARVHGATGASRPMVHRQQQQAAAAAKRARGMCSAKAWGALQRGGQDLAGGGAHPVQHEGIDDVSMLKGGGIDAQRCAVGALEGIHVVESEEVGGAADGAGVPRVAIDDVELHARLRLPVKCTVLGCADC